MSAWWRYLWRVDSEATILSSLTITVYGALLPSGPLIIACTSAQRSCELISNECSIQGFSLWQSWFEQRMQQIVEVDMLIISLISWGLKCIWWDRSIAFCLLEVFHSVLVWCREVKEVMFGGERHIETQNTKFCQYFLLEWVLTLLTLIFLKSLIKYLDWDRLKIADICKVNHVKEFHVYL